MSGLTTTGSTVLSNLDTLPMSINLWRHQLVWVGGMGLIVLAIAILPLLGIGGRQMFKAETPGPMKDSKMTPRIAETAKGLWLVYFGVTVACILGLPLGRHELVRRLLPCLLDAWALGGFSTHDASFGFFDSPAIEGRPIVFMLIAGMNFGTLFLAVSGRSLRAYLHEPEAKAGSSASSLLSICRGCALYLWKDGYLRGLRRRRCAIRRSTSFRSRRRPASPASITTQWPIFAPLWMLFLSCVSSPAPGRPAAASR